MSDLISRSELIKPFEKIQSQKDVIGLYFVEIIDEIKEQPTVYNIGKVIEELEMEMKASSGYSAERVSAFSRAIEIVKQEAEKYNNGWILVSEKLPEDYETYLVTNVDSFGQRHTYKGWYGVEHKIWHMEGNSERKMNVVAWQPLPQPYQPNGE